jgi:hypothetical protein
MNDELTLLREAVRALVAERRAWDQLKAATRSAQVNPIDRAPFDPVRLIECHEAADRALVRLAEVNPGLVYG